MRGVQWPRVQLIDSENAQLKMLSSSVSGFMLASVVFKQGIAKDLTSYPLLSIIPFFKIL